MTASKKIKINKIYNEDCLSGMKRISNKSINMILCDLPYGTTGNYWDNIIPFDELWKEYERIITNEGAIVLTANSSFTNKIISSNEKLYRYKWIWVKNTVTNPMNAKNRPMVSFEEVLVFSKNVTANATSNRMNYFPQDL
ncbi:MAG: site-specific DNA-methyltransferase, partial [Carnobacterium sp.]